MIFKVLFLQQLSSNLYMLYTKIIVYSYEIHTFFCPNFQFYRVSSSEKCVLDIYLLKPCDISVGICGMKNCIQDLTARLSNFTCGHPVYKFIFYFHKAKNRPKSVIFFYLVYWVMKQAGP